MPWKTIPNKKKKHRNQHNSFSFSFCQHWCLLLLRKKISIINIYTHKWHCQFVQCWIACKHVTRNISQQHTKPKHLRQFVAQKHTQEKKNKDEKRQSDILLKFLCMETACKSDMFKKKKKSLANHLHQPCIWIWQLFCGISHYTFV